jgi:uncharacterized membrane protein YgdD (TMEM256/DUF423 family)
MQRLLLLCSAVNGFLAVVLGAFGAHGLRNALRDLPDVARRLDWWETASHYHLAHAVALGVFALASANVPRRWLARASGAVLVGIALFCGSLYVMSLTGVTGLGAITPIGGLGFLAGWALFGIGALRSAPER